MRKTLFAVLGSAVFLAGCGNDNYAIEKQYWLAQRQAKMIFKNPAASPPRQLENAVASLEGFIKKYPDKNVAVEAAFTIARLYIVKEQYSDARATIGKFLAAHPKSDLFSSEGLFVIGNSYEAQGKWDAALEEYNKIMRDYAVSPRGIDIPVYIARYYREKHQPDKMLAAFSNAAKHYLKLAEKYPNSQLALKADTLAAQCFMTIKDWQSALDTIEKIIEKYKGKIAIEPLLLNRAIIYAKELKDLQSAKMVIQQLKTQYPKSKYIPIADKLLKEFSK